MGDITGKMRCSLPDDPNPQEGDEVVLFNVLRFRDGELPEAGGLLSSIFVFPHFQHQIERFHACRIYFVASTLFFQQRQCCGVCWGDSASIVLVHCGRDLTTSFHETITLVGLI